MTGFGQMEKLASIYRRASKIASSIRESIFINQVEDRTR